MRVLLHTGNSSAYRCLEKINRLDPEIRVSVGSRPTNSLDADVVAIPGTASHRPAADIMPDQRACEKKTNVTGTGMSFWPVHAQLQNSQAGLATELP